MSNKEYTNTKQEYQNKSQDYDEYKNKSYSTSKKEESNLSTSSIILSIIICIVSVAIAIEKLGIEKTTNTIRGKGQQLSEKEHDIDFNKLSPTPTKPLEIIQQLLQNNRDEKEYNLKTVNEKKLKIEQQLQSADLETVNKISLELKKLLQEKIDDINKNRLAIKEDKNLSRQKLIEFKNQQKKLHLQKMQIEDSLKLLAKRKSELELPSNIKYIQNFYKMDEPQLLNELNDYLSGKYTYYKNEKLCKPEEIQKELISTAISQNNSNLLDKIITECSVRNKLYINEDYYSEAYSSVFFIRYNCFDVFVKHGIDLKKVRDKKGEGALIHVAAARGNIKIVKQAFDAGIPIDQRTPYNETPLYKAIKSNQSGVAEFLINNGALTSEELDEYNNYGNILFYPVNKKNIDMLKLLTKNGIIVKDNLKTYTNDRKILRFILSKGQNNNENNVNPNDKEWEEAYKYIKSGDLEQLIKIENEGKDLSKMYYDGEPAVCIAIEKNKTQILEHLLKKYDCTKLVDSINGRNALHYAAMSDSYKNLEILLKNGFDPNVLDNDNNTPLNLALCCNYMDKEFIQILLDKGSSPNILNKNNQNSLFFLTNIGYEFSFNSLLEMGVNINHQDSEGNTPLHNYLLKSPERKKNIKPFLEKGANINLVNLKKQTALHLAILTNNTNAAWQLLREGANINQQDIDGNTSLHYVAKYAPNKIMMNTIYNICFGNANLTIKNNEGKTPFNIVEPNCFYQSNFKRHIQAK